MQAPGEEEGKYRLKAPLLEALRESHNESQMKAVQVGPLSCARHQLHGQ